MTKVKRRRYYNLNNFFNKGVVKNEGWVSNGDIIFKKSLLTARQLENVEDMKLMFSNNNDDKMVSIMHYVTDVEKFIDENEKIEFNPVYISSAREFNILYDDNTKVSIQEKYYNFFSVKDCNIYRGNDPHSQLAIYKDGEIVGALMPVRFSGESFKNMDRY